MELEEAVMKFIEMCREHGEVAEVGTFRGKAYHIKLRGTRFWFNGVTAGGDYNEKIEFISGGDVDSLLIEVTSSTVIFAVCEHVSYELYPSKVEDAVVGKDVYETKIEYTEDLMPIEVGLYRYYLRVEFPHGRFSIAFEDWEVIREAV